MGRGDCRRYSTGTGIMEALGRLGRRLVAVAVLAGSWLAADPALGQLALPPKNVPHDGYWLCFQAYLDGDFRDAPKDFRSAGQGAYKSIDGQWIDSICFYTMMGECCFQMGDYGDALDQYNAALQLAVGYRDWM